MRFNYDMIYGKEEINILWSGNLTVNIPTNQKGAKWHTWDLIDSL